MPPPPDGAAAGAQLRVVVVIGPASTGTGAVAAQLSAVERAGTVPDGLRFPTGAEWFGHHGDAVTAHSQLIELAGGDARIPTPREPLQSRQTVRDRLTRLAEDYRRANRPTTALFCAPGAAWRASPAGLRRELRAIADEVAIVIVARRPEVALASMVADAVRRADETGLVSLSARSAASDPALGEEHDYAALLDRWVDPTGVVPLILVPFPEHPRGGTGLVDRVLHRLGVSTLPAAANAPSLVYPTLSRADLVELVRLRRSRGRLGWVPTLGRRLDAQVQEFRRAADERAAAGAEPFRFTESEQRWISRRHRSSFAALRKTLGEQAEHADWAAWFGGD